MKPILSVAVAVLLLASGCSSLPANVPSPKVTPEPTTYFPTQTPSAAAEVPTSPNRLRVELPLIDLPGMTTAPPGQGLEGYRSQKVQWSECEKDFECATIVAPYDYAQPEKKAISLALLRRVGEGSNRPTLFVNPGGPGGSGRSLAASKRWKALPEFDIVGWDPRGTGSSTPITCVADRSKPQPAIDTRLASDMSPDTDAEYDLQVKLNREFAEGCAKYSGDYLTKIGTDQTVQDMELLRVLLQQPTFNFLGYSYGTYLGSYYAHKYPATTGRIVNDSPVNLTTDISLSQAQGFDRAFDAFAQWAAPKKTMGKTPAEVISKLREWFNSLDEKPLKVKDREFTQSLAVTGVAAFLYGDSSTYPELYKVLTQAYEGKVDSLLEMADSLSDRDETGVFAPSAFAFPATACRDTPDFGLAWARQRWAEEKKAAPLFGYFFGPGTTCEQWPTPPLPLNLDYTTTSSTPVLVVATKGDPATPYEYGAWMVKALGNARLLTFDGPGHGSSYSAGSECLDDQVTKYLRGQSVPENGTVCR